MTLSDQNFLAAYMAVGRGFPASRTLRTDAYAACLSEALHPAGNFAVELHLEPWSAAELRSFAADRPAFCLITLPGLGLAHRDEIIRRAGFDPVSRMAQMQYVGRRVEAASPMEELWTQADRQRAAQFIVDQFFVRHSLPIREQVTEALQRADALEMHGRLSNGKLQGIVSICRTEGVVGLYNLAVVHAHRGSGIGREMVMRGVEIAQEAGCEAWIQCPLALEEWYLSLGFEHRGFIDVYEISRRFAV